MLAADVLDAADVLEVVVLLVDEVVPSEVSRPLVESGPPVLAPTDVVVPVPDDALPPLVAV